jgi:hypothetical protein
MFKKIATSPITNDLIEIYTDKEEHTFAVGFVICSSDKELLLNLINSDGIDDGFLLININDIYCVNCETKYIENISLLSNNKQHRLPTFLSQKGYIKNLDLFSEIILFLTETHIITHIKLYNNADYYGYIETNDKDVVIIQIINEYGNRDGFSYIKIEEIAQISFDGIEENRLFQISCNKLK